MVKSDDDDDDGDESLQLCLTRCNPKDIVCQAPLSMGFSRQECWSGLPCPFPGDLPNPGVEPMSLMSPALAIRLAMLEETGDAGSIPVSGRSSGVENGSSLQYSCLEKPMLPGKFHGQKSLTVYSLWGRKELAMTE